MTIITILSIATALLVVTSTSTVYSVLWLVSTFLIISALLGLLNLGFTALLYIIVYVGAIAILFLFVVQLLDLGSVSEQPIDQEYNRPAKNTLTLEQGYNNKTGVSSFKSITPLAIVISISILSIIVFVSQYHIVAVVSDQIINTDSLDSTFTERFNNLISLISSSSSNVNSFSTNSLINTTVNLAPVQGSTPQVQSIAEWFYGPGLLPLIVISIILLVAMIAPISLCKDND